MFPKSNVCRLNQSKNLKKVFESIPHHTHTHTIFRTMLYCVTLTMINRYYKIISLKPSENSILSLLWKICHSLFSSFAIQNHTLTLVNKCIYITKFYFVSREQNNIIESHNSLGKGNFVLIQLYSANSKAFVSAFIIEAWCISCNK